jgi:hypothetical protein
MPNKPSRAAAHLDGCSTYTDLAFAHGRDPSVARSAVVQYYYTFSRKNLGTYVTSLTQKSNKGIGAMHAHYSLCAPSSNRRNESTKNEIRTPSTHTSFRSPVVTVETTTVTVTCQKDQPAGERKEGESERRCSPHSNQLAPPSHRCTQISSAPAATAGLTACHRHPRPPRRSALF